VKALKTAQAPGEGYQPGRHCYKEFNADLADRSARLEAQFQRLGEVWQDPAYSKFADEFR
jgi:hypothetical protein